MRPVTSPAYPGQAARFRDRYSSEPRRFRRSSTGHKSGGKVTTTMMFLALLVPFGLLAVLLGMDRLERWTVKDRDDT